MGTSPVLKCKVSKKHRNSPTPVSKEISTLLENRFSSIYARVIICFYNFVVRNMTILIIIGK